MINSMLDFYQALFGRKFFYKFNQLLYVLSLRGIGILNYKNDRQSGEAHFIKHQVSNIKNGVIFDVGANVGTYSKFIKKLNQHIEIFAFEPHPTTYQKLVSNVKIYGVNTYNIGVGSNGGR